MTTNSDRWAIEDLVHSYADAVCRGDRDAWVATWDLDGVWDIGRGEVRGREAIGAAFDTAMGLFDTVLQFAGSGAAAVDGDRGSGRRYLHEHARTRSGEALLYHGYYDDRYVRTGDGWRFASRRLAWLYQGSPDLSGTFGPPAEYEDHRR